MANKSVVRLDKVKSVYNGNIFSVRSAVALENGFVGKLGDIEAANRDVHALVAPVALDKLVLIANPALVYDNARLGSGLENQYAMEANEVVRAYELAANDVVGIAKEGVNGTALVGQYLVAGAGFKLVPSATKPASGFAAKVVRLETVGGTYALNATQVPTVYVVIEVLQN